MHHTLAKELKMNRDNKNPSQPQKNNTQQQPARKDQPKTPAKNPAKK